MTILQCFWSALLYCCSTIGVFSLTLTLPYRPVLNCLFWCILATIRNFVWLADLYEFQWWSVGVRHCVILCERFHPKASLLINLYVHRRAALYYTYHCLIFWGTIPPFWLHAWSFEAFSALGFLLAQVWGAHPWSIVLSCVLRLLCWQGHAGNPLSGDCFCVFVHGHHGCVSYVGISFGQLRHSRKYHCWWFFRSLSRTTLNHRLMCME